MINCFEELTSNELENVDGGLAITVLGVTLVGWKAAVAIGGGCAAVAAIAGTGFYLGYK